MNLIGRNLCATAAHRAFPFFFSLILFIGTLLAPPLRAAYDNDKNTDSTAAPPPTVEESRNSSGTSVWHQPYMFNWGPERQRLEDKGLKFTFFYITDAFGNKKTPKEVDEQFSAWYRIRGTVDVDFGKFTAAKGLTFHITGLWQGGQNMGNIIGSLVNPSSLVSIHTFRLDSAWLQQSLFDGKLLITGGQMATQDFYGLGLMGNNFLMEPFGYNFGIMGNAGASWDPASGPAGNIKVFPIKPIKNFYFQTGYFSGRNYSETGWNYSKKTPPTYNSEIGYSFDGNAASGKTYPGTYEVGSIYNNGYWNSGGVHTFTSANPPYLPTQGNYLVYFQGAQAVYRVEPGSNRGLDVLFGLTRSPDGVLHAVNQEYKMGASFNGPLSFRPKDTVSFGFVYSKIEGKYNDYLTSIGKPKLNDEKALELSYRAQVTPWMILQPTMQHYSSLGGVSGHEAYLAGLRLQVFF